MAKFECNESEGLSCVARLQSMDPAARWQDSEEEKWANHGVSIPSKSGHYSRLRPPTKTVK